MIKNENRKVFDTSSTSGIDVLATEMIPPRYKDKKSKDAYREGFRDAVNYMKRNKA